MGRRASSRKPPHRQPALDASLEYDGSTMLPNPREELFCQLYTSNTTPRFFGHGQNSYSFAYGYQEKLIDLEVKRIGADTRRGRGKNRKLVTAFETIDKQIKRMEGLCRTQASYLLTKPHIIARCDFLMDKLIEDKIVDRELAYVIQQRFELSSKTAAIIHYDKKRGRLIEKQESLVKFEPITAIEFILPPAPKK